MRNAADSRLQPHGTALTALGLRGMRDKLVSLVKQITLAVGLGLAFGILLIVAATLGSLWVVSASLVRMIDLIYNFLLAFMALFSRGTPLQAHQGTTPTRPQPPDRATQAGAVPRSAGNSEARPQPARKPPNDPADPAKSQTQQTPKVDPSAPELSSENQDAAWNPLGIPNPGQ